MATFLAIYSKENKVDHGEIEPVVADFTLHGARPVVKREYPGLLIYVAEQFGRFLFEADDCVSFVSGHISFEGLADKLPAASIAASFDRCISAYGPASLSKLEGAFAALRYNVKEHQLLLANNKFGTFPLFIFENEKYIIVSNEYQPLFCFQPKEKWKLNYEAVTEFFVLGVTLGDKTFFRGISNLSPATYAITETGSLKYRQYWVPEPAIKMEHNVDDLATDLLATFTKVNQEYLEAGHTDMCLLTAGADSRLILATMTDEQRLNTRFYTSNLSFLDAADDKDVIGASMLAKKFGLHHQVEKISFYETPFGTDYFDKERQLRKSQVYGGWHGGEFLGGYMVNLPIAQQQLSFSGLDEKLKSIFSWRFRWKLKLHPYQSYLQEQERHGTPAADVLFLILQATRGFFTGIYSGTRGHWVQPYQLTNHGLSPFWDSRFLQQIIQIPIETLKDYNVYNHIFRQCKKEYTDIPSNSLLTNREDTAIPKLTTGTEPKNQVPNTHHKEYTKRLTDQKVWRRHFYNDRKLKEVLSNELDPLTKRWLDFETWYARYMGA